jgi:hypothetical protein
MMFDLELKEKSTPVIHGVMACNIYLSWGWAGSGFGELSVSLVDGKVMADTS